MFRVRRPEVGTRLDLRTPPRKSPIARPMASVLRLLQPLNAAEPDDPPAVDVDIDDLVQLGAEVVEEPAEE
jgi:hypothetical protein